MANFIGMSNDKTAKVNKRWEFDLRAKIFFGANGDLLEMDHYPDLKEFSLLVFETSITEPISG